MGKKITYLIGAGASYNAIPTVEGLAEDMNKLINDLEVKYFKERIFDSQGNKFTNPYIPWEGGFVRMKEIKKSIVSITEKIKQYGTIDTYAKYLLITNDVVSLNKLKKITTFYFLMRQFFFNKIDDRYLGLFVSIMESMSFPLDVNILTWNYDLQMEITLQKNFPDNLVKTYPHIDAIANSGKFNIEKIDIIHLNGIAGIYLDSSLSWINLLSEIHNIKDIDDKFKFILEHSMNDKKNDLLTFAFEKDFNRGSYSSSNTIEKALYNSRGTEILVILGYSFPFFNREIDKQIFDKIKNSSLDKIYYYDSSDRNGQFLKSQFGLREGIEIEKVSFDPKRFFIPFEL